MAPVRFGVVGLEHPHVYQATMSLLGAGAELVATHATGDGAADFAGGFGGEVRDADGVIGDDSIDVVVVAAVPDERADLSRRSMEAGKDVLAIKPAVLTLDDLELLRRAHETTGRFFSVYFSERLESRCTSRAEQLVADGAIGRVVHVLGSGPHRLSPELRPHWFFDPTRAGGILADLATHQIDQVLQFGSLTADGQTPEPEIVSAAVANHATPDHPDFHDHGELHLRVGDVSGFVRVDWLTPAGLPTWGDVRLFVFGTAGSIELRKNVDLAGREGGEHLFVVDGDGVRHVDCSDDPVPFAERFVDDVRTRGQAHLDQHHCFSVCELAIRAQASAG